MTPTHLSEIKKQLLALKTDKPFLSQVFYHNNWFIEPFVCQAIDSIASEYLDESKVAAWRFSYPSSISSSEIVGIIAAGNIPLVGFQDFFCAYMSGVTIHIKLSSKDTLLMKRVLDIFCQVDTSLTDRLHIVDTIKDCTKIIATGSNNSNTYFEYYFSKYQHILRKNRTSVAILHKDISADALDRLMDDFFLYFGLGCRNVSKLYIEDGFELSRIFEAAERYAFLFEQQKYMNNYDYQRTLLLLNQVEHFSNNFLMLKEDQSIFSPISVVHYEYYDDIATVQNQLHALKESIQCIVADGYIPFGDAQKPSLNDYPDGVDIMKFLMK